MGKHNRRDSMGYDLGCEFDIEMHKQMFIHYLEVLIEPNGHVLYAVPSHQELAIALACKLKGWAREQLAKACPPHLYFDFLDWLLELTGCISVWETFYKGKPNEAQYAKLVELKRAGLYRGELEYESKTNQSKCRFSYNWE